MAIYFKKQYPAACCDWDKGHTYSTQAWISPTWFHFYAAAPWMPRSLLRVGAPPQFHSN